RRADPQPTGSAIGDLTALVIANRGSETRHKLTHRADPIALDAQIHRREARLGHAVLFFDRETGQVSKLALELGRDLVTARDTHPQRAKVISPDAVISNEGK